mmetsp:Transcript_68762/g.223941  ORF Transcript_68762/g.223941 Transcript_68762/m.223941 type:complete len:589 (-) Transcript_68762:65-1831(-)
MGRAARSRRCGVSSATSRNDRAWGGEETCYLLTPAAALAGDRAEFVDVVLVCLPRRLLGGAPAATADRATSRRRHRGSTCWEAEAGAERAASRGFSARQQHRVAAAHPSARRPGAAASRAARAAAAAGRPAGWLGRSCGTCRRRPWGPRFFCTSGQRICHSRSGDDTHSGAVSLCAAIVADTACTRRCCDLRAVSASPTACTGAGPSDNAGTHAPHPGDTPGLGASLGASLGAVCLGATASRRQSRRSRRVGGLGPTRLWRPLGGNGRARAAAAWRQAAGKDELVDAEAERQRWFQRDGLGASGIWAAALVAGPLAGLAYPTLRSLSAAVQQDDQSATSVCWVLGVCGGVPPALQDFFKSTVGLLFSFLLGYTFYILVARQVALYNSLFEETAVLTQLIEESQMFLPREDVLKILTGVRQYIALAWADEDYDPATVSAKVLRSNMDAVEQMSRILVDGIRAGNPIYGEVLTSVRALRMARARRLAAMQSPIPGVQYGLLSTLALFAALPPFLEPSGGSSTLSQVLYGLLVAVLVLVLAVVLDVANPRRPGAYSMDREMSIILIALQDTLNGIEADEDERRSTFEFGAG